MTYQQLLQDKPMLWKRKLQQADDQKPKKRRKPPPKKRKGGSDSDDSGGGTADEEKLVDKSEPGEKSTPKPVRIREDPVNAEVL